MNAEELERLTPTEKTALAKRLARKGEEIGHQLAKQGHPVVASLGTFTFAHAEEKYTTGTYAQETLSAMNAAARFPISLEMTEIRPSSRMTPIYLVIAMGYVVGIPVSQQGSAVRWIGLLLLSAALVLIIFAFWKRSTIILEDRLRVAKYEWLESIIAEPIWAGMRIALAEYEEERLAAQEKAEVVHAEQQIAASQPYYPSPAKEPELVTFSTPASSEKWNPPARKSSYGGLGPSSRHGRRRQAETFQQAELACTRWLQLHGEPSAQLTRDGADGGVDIVSKRFVCQVKNYRGSVGVPPIRALYGIAVAEEKEALFFTTGTYTKAAIEFADKVEMPLFTFDARVNDASGANPSARRRLSKGRV